MPWRVAAVESLPEFRLRVRFVDDTKGVVDLTDLIQSPNAGVFAALADPSIFKQAFVEHGAVTWPDGIDLAPDAMYAVIARQIPMDSAPAGKRIGVAKGKFKVPDDINADNNNIAHLFLGKQNL
jgi:hypothetical protein